MKKILFSLVFIMMGLATQMFALSTSTIRTHARFLSDRMAYELDLTPMQYDDCYEINYDYIYHVSKIMDDVVYGYRDAINEYYDLLDDRNEDLRYVLNRTQYAKLMSLDYFYRPVYSTGRKWAFRVYTIYSNRSFYYYDAPKGFKTYKGTHHKQNYYQNRYKHETHKGDVKIKSSKNFDNHSRNDFGTVRKERNNKQQNSINNYSNSKQQNRTQDARYQDKSGNKNSPQINHRDDKNNNTTKPQDNKGNSQNSKPQDNKGKDNKGNNKPQGGRR